MAPTAPWKRVRASLSSETPKASSPSSGVRAASPEVSDVKAPDRKNNMPSIPRTISWPLQPKAVAVTEVARESISASNQSSLAVDQQPAAGPSRELSTRSPSIGLTKKDGGSSWSLPANATTTKLSVTSQGTTPPTFETNHEFADPAVRENSPVKTPKPGQQVSVSHPQPNEERGGDVAEQTSAQVSENTANKEKTQKNQGGWFSWFTSGQSGGETQNMAKSNEPAEEAQPEVPRPATPEPSEPRDIAPRSDKAEVSTTSVPTIGRSWLSFWSSSNDTQRNLAEDEVTGESTQPNKGSNIFETRDIQPASTGDNTPLASTTRSSWRQFWTRESMKDSGEKPGSEAEAKRSRSLTDLAQANGPVNDSTERLAMASSASTTQLPSDTLAPSAVPPKKGKASNNAAKGIHLPNQVLPAVKDTLKVRERPGIIQQLSRLFSYGKHTESKHSMLSADPPRIKKAIAIGIHGYFPAPLLRSVLGQPTGTSTRFSTMAENSIAEWAEAHNSPCEIKKIALEGEGRIMERVDMLWKLLLSYIDDIKEADFLLFACHSQGVPVATMIISNLLTLGCTDTAKIGICAMAGVSLGPFSDYRSRFIGGVAGELFDFASPTSKVSREYRAALEHVLQAGVRIVYIGSVDDQLVPLESSMFATVSHPYIYRAVFVDGRVHAPSFLSHLIGFLMKLRNLGISDHGLIKELSSPVAGSLVSGEGHSRIYDESAVYRLAVEFILESSSVANPVFETHKFHSPPTPNPYILPFAMRGVLEEDYVRRQLADETNQLLRQFDDWKPVTKGLRDVKFRLEGIRSKL